LIIDGEDFLDLSSVLQFGHSYFQGIAFSFGALFT